MISVCKNVRGLTPAGAAYHAAGAADDADSRSSSSPGRKRSKKEFDHAGPGHQQTFVHANRRPRTGRRRCSGGRHDGDLAADPYAQASSDSLLRTVLDRGHLIVGTGSTNVPWHFEDEQGNLVGMDIAMAQILAQGLFDDPTKVEYVKQEADARIPNVTTGKVDITIQFMTVTAGRAQLVNFTRPYYVEGIALLTKPGSTKEKFDALLAGGGSTMPCWLGPTGCRNLVL
jgi:ABC-type amino acid transport substrate-binding protein